MRIRCLLWASLALVAGLDLPALAGPSFENLVWTHPKPAQIAGFKVLMATEPDGAGTVEVLDVGLPGRDGLFRLSLGIPDNESIWVAVVAVDQQGRESSPSAWHRLDWDPARQQLQKPPQPFLVREAPR
jgi:hypothetical protein